MVNARAVLSALWLLCPGVSFGLDDLALVQGAVHAGLGPTSTLVKQAEQVLKTVGSLEMHTRPTQTDKESLMMAQALLKNPELIQFYMPPPPKQSASDVKDGLQEAAKAEAEWTEAKDDTKAAVAPAATLRGRGNQPAPGGTHAAASSSPHMVRKVPSPASIKLTAVSKKLALASKHHTPSAGNCSNEDKLVMLERGPGNSPHSFPGIVAQCGKKAFRLSGMSSQAFLSCLNSELNNGLLQPCGECFLDAAAYGVRHCAMRCMRSWCSTGCLDCAQSYRTTSLLKCVGFDSPEAVSCR